MCYEFVHDCKNSFGESFGALSQQAEFFIVCIGHLNYLYFTDKAAGDIITRFLVNGGILLYALPLEEMRRVLDFPATKEYQIFHGSRLLYAMFKQNTIA